MQLVRQINIDSGMIIDIDNKELSITFKNENDKVIISFSNKDDLNYLCMKSRLIYLREMAMKSHERKKRKKLLLDSHKGQDRSGDTQE